MGLPWLACSSLLAAAVAAHGYRKKSLSFSGSIAAAAVGSIHLSCGLMYGLVLILFYFSSSKVLANSGLPAASLVALAMLECAAAAAPGDAASAFLACARAVVQGGLLGHYSCCCADTWASEIGVLSSTPPRLITTLQQVPAGTNGGVSSLGMASSLAAGGFIGCVALAALRLPPLLLPDSVPVALGAPGLQQGLFGNARLLLLAALSLGLIGTSLDSLLGAELQFSGRDVQAGGVVDAPRPGVVRISGRHLLSNSAVNLVSASCCWLLGGMLQLKASGLHC